MGANKVIYGTTTIIDISDSTVNENNLLKDKIAYGANGDRIVGTMPVFYDQQFNLSLTNKYITLDTGYHADSTVSIRTEKEKEVTPTKDGVTVSPKTGYLLSTVKVKGDNNLIPENIAEGVSIFGINGTHSGGASIETCTVNLNFSIATRYGFVGATTFSNGTISRFSSQVSTIGTTVTIPNVVCGSTLFVYVGTMSSVYGWTYGKDISGDAYAHVLSAPNTAGEYTAEIGELDD